jgi:hypothetical protein
LERKATDEVAEAKKKLAAKNRRGFARRFVAFVSNFPHENEHILKRHASVCRLGAMMCLKRKKAYEAQIQRLSGASKQTARLSSFERERVDVGFTERRPTVALE